MFDSIRTRHRFFTILLTMLFVVPTFIATGVYSYNQFLAADTSVAKVGSERISQQELDQAMRERLERMAQAMGANFDSRVFDTPQARVGVLDSMLSERALRLEVERAHMLVSDHKVQEAIESIPAFQQAGRFDFDTYKTLLASRGMNTTSFESDMRGDLLKQALMDSVAGSAVLPRTVFDRLWQLQHEKREVRELVFRPEAYLDKAEVGEDAIKAEYQNNQSRYLTPETVRAEYVVFRASDLAPQMTVSPEEVRAFYDRNLTRWGQPERRRASHILVTAGPGGSAPDKAQARKIADTVLAKVRANPADFAKLAKEYSKDPGSAAKGGDLGWFGHGMMVKPFEDAVFSMKEGQTSGIVATDFGFHIIRVTGVEASRTKPFDEVKGQIEAELRQQAAEKKFAEVAEQFSNFVYEQADGLKAAADKFKLPLREVDGLTPKGPPPGEAAGIFTPAVIAELFAPDSLAKRKNIKAVEIGGNALVSARVLDHHAAAPMPLEVVKVQIKAALQRAAAAELARKAGQQKLAELQKAPADDGFDASRWVSRDEAQQVPPQAVTAIMQLAADHLPAYVGVEGPDGGYLLLHVLSVKAADPPAPGAVAGASQQWLGELSSADQASFLQGLRQRFGAKIVRADLTAPQKQDQQQ